MYTQLNIVIREAKLTNFVTDLAVIFNTNDSKLKSEIEKIVNGLQLNTTTGIIGEPGTGNVLPLNEINTRTLWVVLPTTVTEGWKSGFKMSPDVAPIAGMKYLSTAIENYVVNRSTSNVSDSYTLAASAPALAGFHSVYQSILVDSLIQCQTVKAQNVKILNTTLGLLDCDAPAQFNNIVLHKSGHKESIATDVSTLVLDGTTTLYAIYNLTKNTPENIFVKLKVPADGYTAGAWVTAITNLELRLKIDENAAGDKPMPGQVFNFILDSIVDATDVPIQIHPKVDIKIKPNLTFSPTVDFLWKNYGNNGLNTRVTEIVFVPSAYSTGIPAMNSLDTYASNLSLIYNYEIHPAASIYSSVNHMMYVKNHFTKI